MKRKAEQNGKNSSKMAMTYCQNPSSLFWTDLYFFASIRDWNTMKKHEKATQNRTLIWYHKLLILNANPWGSVFIVFQISHHPLPVSKTKGSYWGAVGLASPFAEAEFRKLCVSPALFATDINCSSVPRISWCQVGTHEFGNSGKMDHWSRGGVTKPFWFWKTVSTVSESSFDFRVWSGFWSRAILGNLDWSDVGMSWSLLRIHWEPHPQRRGGILSPRLERWTRSRGMAGMRMGRTWPEKRC